MSVDEFYNFVGWMQGLVVEYRLIHNKGKRLVYTCDAAAVEVDLVGQGPVRLTKKGRKKATSVELGPQYIEPFLAGLTELARLSQDYPGTVFNTQRLSELADRKPVPQKYQGKPAGTRFGDVQPAFSQPRVVNRPPTPYHHVDNKELLFSDAPQQGRNDGHFNNQQQQPSFVRQPERNFNQQQPNPFNQPPQNAFNDYQGQQAFNQGQPQAFNQGQPQAFNQGQPQAFNQSGQQRPWQSFGQQGIKPVQYQVAPPSAPTFNAQVQDWFMTMDVSVPVTPPPLVSNIDDADAVQFKRDIKEVFQHLSAEHAKYIYHFVFDLLNAF